ncbi:acyltransferase family protein [Desertibacillus haloalkaliphilus]|nr:acyltransferase family protein [Desertibacillus haloalkaliphilus]
MSIVFLHSIAWGMEHIQVMAHLPEIAQVILDSMNVFLYYGTPTFIFITAFILGYSYRDRENLSATSFLLKRFKFILVPYLCMAVLYALPYTLLSTEQFLLKVFLNAFIGDFHAYFVLIIFQFYFLFLIFKKWLDHGSLKQILGLSLIINIAYLAFFNFTSAPSLPFADYIWERYYWVPFPGWIFYFTLAYYIGTNYQWFKAMLLRYKTWVIVAPLLSGALTLYLYHSGLLTTHSSKRIDIILHTFSIIVFVLYIALKLKSIPRFFIVVSDYSFGIYLLHTLFMSALILVIDTTAIDLGLLTFIILFAGSTMASMVSVHYLNKLKIGKYIVGKVNVKQRVKVDEPSTVRTRARSLFVNYK